MRKSELIAMLKSIEGDYEVTVRGDTGVEAHIVDKHFNEYSLGKDGSLALLIVGPEDESVGIELLASDS